ncbi:cytochrome c oxidase subunit CcoM [Marinobacter sp.]|uniref:cytochrome c oxidase subunit CcoM n=1 Tax=Marinobacter sp. TaxID=50741 RepID=UPI003A5BF603
MFMDVVVFAGIATVLLMICFFVGVGLFIRKDQERHDEKAKRKGDASQVGLS